MTETPRPYLSGLHLAGRRVVVLGGGAVVQRRLVALLETGAQVTVIAPEVTPEIAVRAKHGELSWERRAYRIGDLAEAWYVLVATDDEPTNRAASIEAEQNRTFCVRADAADAATAWTPASAEVDGVQIAVLAGGNPRVSRSVRDLLVTTLRQFRRRAA